MRSRNVRERSPIQGVISETPVRVGSQSIPPPRTRDGQLVTVQAKIASVSELSLPFNESIVATETGGISADEVANQR